uniref:Uncharacterized protein n=2 Tax=Lutzomyia longipalpis TaxID=7200 RepID=A0A1B0CKA9_LUTLO
MNNYQAAAAAAQGFGPPASPHTATTRSGFPPANSPGPTIDMYNSSGADSVGYVQAASPQPSGFPAIAVSRAPLNYSPWMDALNRQYIMMDDEYATKPRGGKGNDTPKSGFKMQIVKNSKSHAKK